MGSPSEQRSRNLNGPRSSRVNCICIIGAGPSGLAAAKYLLAENAFSKVKIFEQRAKPGGLWNYSPVFDDAPDRLAVPQTSPDRGHEEPVWLSTEPKTGQYGHADGQLMFMSPVYDELETNIPRELMGFPDLDWPNDCQLFPKHKTVLEYLEDYSHDVAHLIQFETQVLDVGLDKYGSWTVKTRKLSRGTAVSPKVETFDAVIVASGHFNVPFIPQVSGLGSWNREHLGTILHSKFYRRPEDYANRKVIVVGNSASGVDIASQVSHHCKLPLLQSQKSESFLQPDQSPTKVEKPEIVEYIPEGRKVRFADGTVETDIDAVIYCTGYFYSFPFLESLDPPVIRSGECVQNLYQHIFYRPHPTLSFVALNQKIVPFPVAEAQSAVIARVLSGRLALPSESEMERWEQSTLEETGGGRNFHVLKFPKDADYINMLHDWAVSAEQEGGVHHELRKRRLSSSTIEKVRGMSKEPPYWGEKEYWARERFPKIKKAFQRFGEERESKKTMEDVGFSFEQWKKERIEEARTLL